MDVLEIRRHVVCNRLRQGQRINQRWVMVVDGVCGSFVVVAVAVGGCGSWLQPLQMLV